MSLVSDSQLPESGLHAEHQPRVGAIHPRQQASSPLWLLHSLGILLHRLSGAGCGDFGSGEEKVCFKGCRRCRLDCVDVDNRWECPLC